MSFKVLFVLMVGPQCLLDYSQSVGYTTSYNQFALFATKGIHSFGLSYEWVSLDSIVMFQMFPTSRRTLRVTCFVPGTYMSQYAGDYMKYMSNGSWDAWTYFDPKKSWGNCVCLNREYGWQVYPTLGLTNSQKTAQVYNRRRLPWKKSSTFGHHDGLGGFWPLFSFRDRYTNGPRRCKIAHNFTLVAPKLCTYVCFPLLSCMFAELSWTLNWHGEFAWICVNILLLSYGWNTMLNIGLTRDRMMMLWENGP